MERSRNLRKNTARLLCASVLGLALTAVAATPAGAADTRCAAVPPISAGGFSSYSLAGDGRLWDWGDNWAGQLGNGQSNNTKLTPINIAGLGPLVSVAGGGSHAIALKPDGTVWAWGWNIVGQLGDSTTINRTTPVQVQSLSDVRTIAAGVEYSFAIKADGTVWAWGRNDRGQLGDGTTIDRRSPVQITALTGFTAVAPGGMHTLALKADGTVWSWGDNGGAGMLGRGALNTVHPTPGQVPGISGVTAVSAAATYFGHSVALKSNGTVWSWGNNLVGQLGNGSFSDSTTPVQATGVSGVTDVDAGGFFTLARKSDSTLWAWGQNTFFELGNTNAAEYQPTAVQVMNISGVALASGGGNHSIALTSDGKTRTWGYNAFGAIGDGTTNTRATPFLTSVSQAVPTTPADLAATAGEELAWLEFSEPSSLMTQYVVTPYVGGVAQTPVYTDMPEQPYVVSDLTKGATYAFKVAAQNCLGTGPATGQSNKVIPTGVRLDDNGFKIESEPVTDRMTLSVNTFNGNLSLTAADLHVAGTGLDLGVARRYNSRADASSIFGNRWVGSIGNDVRLELLANGSVFVHGPAGEQWGFVNNTDGSYQTPPGLSARLDFDNNGTPAVTSDDTYVLTKFPSEGRAVFSAVTGRLVRHVDRNDNTISYAYGGPGGKLSAITDTQGRTTSLAYNGAGLVATITDPIGRLHQYTYTSGNLTKYRDPANADTFFAYTSGNLTKITTPEGRVVAVTYNGSRQVTSLKWSQAPGTPTTSFSYLADRTIVTDPNGKPTTYHYDPVGRTTSVVDALGNTASLDYTSQSNVRAYSKGSATTTFGYTSAHALNSVGIPTGATTTAQYNDPAHPHSPTRIDDPQGNRLIYSYNAAGNLLTQTADQLPIQNKVELTYNSRGRVTTSRDPNGNLTVNTYDTAGNLTGVNPPAPLGAVGLGYDGASRVTSITDGNNQTKIIGYDPLDRVTSITYADGSSITRSYDRDGNLVTEADATGTTTMAYDPMNRLVSRTTPDGAAVTYGYDKASNLTTITDAGGTVTYTYNAVNLPSQIREPGGATSTMTYSARYSRTSLAYPNGVSLFYAHDTSDRLTGIDAEDASQSQLLSLTYSYRNPSTGNNDTSLRFSVTDNLTGRKTSYTYDVLNRLTKALTTEASGLPVVEYRYTYDGNGNRLKVETDFPEPAIDFVDFYTYNAANQLTLLNNETFTYDGDGNLTDSSLGVELSYNAAGQTTSIRPRADKGTPAEFLYRGAGQTERRAAGLVAKDTGDLEPVCVLTCVDPPDVVVAEITFDHSVLGVSSRGDATDTDYYTRDPAGQLVGQRTPDGAQYFLTDGLGSVVGVTDTGGATLATYAYDPYGNVTAATGDAEITPWRYTGAYLDDTGLYKMGERYYPTIGRWTQQDPIHRVLDPKLWNRYIYVGGDPINFVDPTGLSWWNPGSWDWCGDGPGARLVEGLSLIPPVGGDTAEWGVYAASLNQFVLGLTLGYVAKQAAVKGALKIAAGVTGAIGVGVTGTATLIDLGRRTLC